MVNSGCGKVSFYVGELFGGGGGAYIMGKVDTFIPELPANLVDPVKTTNDKFLEEQLRCNAQAKVHVQIVVVRCEWFCG